MGAVIPAKILGLEGQVIKDVLFNEESGRVRVICDRDRRRRPVDHLRKNPFAAPNVRFLEMQSRDIEGATLSRRATVRRAILGVN
jgi:hypothetical protein